MLLIRTYRQTVESVRRRLALPSVQLADAKKNFTCSASSTSAYDECDPQLWLFSGYALDEKNASTTDPTAYMPALSASRFRAPFVAGHSWPRKRRVSRWSWVYWRRRFRSTSAMSFPGNSSPELNFRYCVRTDLACLLAPPFTFVYAPEDVRIFCLFLRFWWYFGQGDLVLRGRYGMVAPSLIGWLIEGLVG